MTEIIAVSTIDGVHIVELTGVLNIKQKKVIEEQLEPLLASEEVSKCIMDLTKLEWMDSSGLGVIVHCYNLMEGKHAPEGRKRSFVICGLGKNLKLAFKIAHLDRIFKVYKDRAEAMAAI